MAQAALGLNFDLTEEQQMLQKMARDFAAQEIIPQAAHFDTTAEFPIDIINKGRRIGLVNLNIPEEYGGPGASVLDECIVAEGDSGIPTMVARASSATGAAFETIATAVAGALGWQRVP